LRQVIASDRLDAAAIHNRHGDIVYRLPDPDKYMGKNIAGGDAFKLYLDSPQHFTRYSGVTVTDKDRRVLVFSKVNGADLDIAVSGRYDDVMKSWRMNGIWKALLFVVVAVLALTLAWEIQRRLAERKLAEETIHQLAFNDTLTKLPNRRLLSERLNQSMVSSQRSGRYGALMFMDLDNLKPLNDTHGHDAGDALLVEVATRLVSCIRAMDTVARFGGDEFVVLLRELAVDKTESSAQAAMVAEKIRAILAEPYVLSVTDRGNVCTMVEHHSSASIGVVLFRNHEASQDDILRWADDTMYQAKDAGRNVVRFFEAPGQT
jgi:diguanylate cyclase (GGDEF)-like protein